MNEELKKKAADAFKTGADAAKKLGGIAYDLGKKGFAAARDKAKELGEMAKESNRMAEEEAQKVERLAAEMRREQDERDSFKRQSAERAAKWQGDPEDKHLYLSRGWLFAIWWFWNVVFTIVCLWFTVGLASTSYTRDNAWIPLVALAVLLILNRIAYEFAIAFLEMVKHLRQIRDELRRHNMREEDLLAASEKNEEQSPPPDALP